MPSQRRMGKKALPVAHNLLKASMFLACLLLVLLLSFESEDCSMTVPMIFGARLMQLTGCQRLEKIIHTCLRLLFLTSNWQRDSVSRDHCERTDLSSFLSSWWWTFKHFVLVIQAMGESVRWISKLRHLLIGNFSWMLVHMTEKGNQVPTSCSLTSTRMHGMCVERTYTFFLGLAGWFICSHLQFRGIHIWILVPADPATPVVHRNPCRKTLIN